MHPRTHALLAAARAWFAATLGHDLASATRDLAAAIRAWAAAGCPDFVEVRVVADPWREPVNCEAESFTVDLAAGPHRLVSTVR